VRKIGVLLTLRLNSGFERAVGSAVYAVKNILTNQLPVTFLNRVQTSGRGIEIESVR
jgi:hypothetical protein